MFDGKRTIYSCGGGRASDRPAKRSLGWPLASSGFRGQLALDVEIKTLAPLTLAGVAVKLDGRILWLQPRAPKPGEVGIDAATMGEGAHRLSILAVDNRGALGRQDVYLKAADAGTPAV